jgi:hypothetical protein
MMLDMMKIKEEKVNIPIARPIPIESVPSLLAWPANSPRTFVLTFDASFRMESASLKLVRNHY